MSPVERLCFGEASSVMLICAHPDDEVIGAGAQLLRWRKVFLVYVTDGAPRNEAAALAAGFHNRLEYAQARRHERTLAINLMTARHPSGNRIELLDLNFADQEAAFHMVEMAHALAEIIRHFQPEFVVTHPYEGGHPDHDSTAFAVTAARQLLHQRGLRSPAHLEMTSYHAGIHGMVSGEFLPAPETEVISIPLTPAEKKLKTRLFACYQTQSKVLQYFQMNHERFRMAPVRDFCIAPHSGRLWYENFNWGMTGNHWRYLAKIALTNLGLPASDSPRKTLVMGYRRKRPSLCVGARPSVRSDVRVPAIALKTRGTKSHLKLPWTEGRAPISNCITNFS